MRRLPLSVFCLLGAVAVLPAGSQPGAPSAPLVPKTHVLFMGAELQVQREKKYHRVEDVVGSELKIRIGRREILMPTRHRSTNLRVGHALKLAGVTVTLDELQSGPGYTPANDPTRKAIAAAGAAGGAAAVQDLEQGQMLQVATAAAHADRVEAANPGIPDARAAAERMRIELREAEIRSGSAGHLARYERLNDPAAHADRRQGELAEGNFDAMEVSFKVASPVELDDPHVVVLFKFQPRDAKPGDEGMVIHAQSLDPLGPKPRFVRVRQGGLPHGFRFLDCEVHLFNRGAEVATNVSSRRVELTREEARQYVVIEHLGANRDATVPAAVVAGTLPPGRLKTLTTDQVNRICYARIGPDGHLLGVFADASCRQQLADTALEATLAEMLFRPALRAGRAIEGVARVRLAEI